MLKNYLIGGRAFVAQLRFYCKEQVQFLERLECPEWEVDLDAVRVEDLTVEIARQSFAYEVAG
jgi:hypothetical protein